MIILLIGIGGAIGSIARYLLGRAVQGALHLEFPIGTFVVNVVGCLVIGVLAKFFMNSQTEIPLRATLMTASCGGLHDVFIVLAWKRSGPMRAEYKGRAVRRAELPRVRGCHRSRLCSGAAAKSVKSGEQPLRSLQFAC